MNPLILALSLAANDGTYGFTSPNWTVAPAACEFKSTLAFQGEAGSVVHVQFTTDVEGSRPSPDGLGYIGQAWVDCSPAITLDGTVQTFSTGAFVGAGFYRLRQN